MNRRYKVRFSHIIFLPVHNAVCFVRWHLELVLGTRQWCCVGVRWIIEIPWILLVGAEHRRLVHIDPDAVEGNALVEACYLRCPPVARTRLCEVRKRGVCIRPDNCIGRFINTIERFHSPPNIIRVFIVLL